MKKCPISFIQVELTNHCNYRCEFCPQSQWESRNHPTGHYHRSRGYMSFSLFCDVVSQANEIAKEINFSFFGEPMMHPEFETFLDFLEKERAPDIKIVFNTNLSFATKAIFEKLIKLRPHQLRFSIDAATTETYDLVRPGNGGRDLEGNPMTGDRFESICGKARYWFSLPAHSPTRHVFTVNSSNIKEMDSFARQWLPLLGEKDHILFKNVLTYGGKINDPMIIPDPCNVWELNSLTVDWTGRVSPCNLDTNMELAVGTLEEKSMLELFHSDNMKRFRKQSKKKQIQPCKDCIDGNNWQRNIKLFKGDQWREEIRDGFLSGGSLAK